MHGSVENILLSVGVKQQASADGIATAKIVSKWRERETNVTGGVSLIFRHDGATHDGDRIVA